MASLNSVIERDTELWNSAMGELHKGVITLQVGGEMRTFSLPKPIDDDGTDISLKDWELGSQTSRERMLKAAYPLKSFKGISVRTKFTPIEPLLDEDHSSRHSSSPDRFDTAPTTPRTPRASSSSGAHSRSVSPTGLGLKSIRQLDSPCRGDLSLPAGVFYGDGSYHLHKVDVSSDNASPCTPGIATDRTNSNEESSDHSSNLRARSERCNALHVSFDHKNEVEKGPSTPRPRKKSPLKSRSTRATWNDQMEEQPKWESSTKIRPRSTSMPRTHHVQPTLHGIRSRSTTISSAVKLRNPPLPLPEIETMGRRNVMLSLKNRGSELRSSLDSQSIGERTKFFDASSSFTPSSPVSSSFQSRREVTASTSKLESPSFLLRSNARRHHDETEEDEDEGEVGMLCGGGFVDSNISGDFVRLLGKLCRVSVPVQKQPAPKSLPQQADRNFERSNTLPSSWETRNATIRENFVILGRHASLKLLSERCSNGPSPPYNVHKVPRKIRDHAPHQHFYKPISKSLDQKLRS
uniref:Uncharacterized protein n=1 Tax=Physcomitrium patens TaxID=3218 RepID=A0A7I4E5A8_PHYPA